MYVYMHRSCTAGSPRSVSLIRQPPCNFLDWLPPLQFETTAAAEQHWCHVLHDYILSVVADSSNKSMSCRFHDSKYESCVHCFTQRYKLDKFGVITHMDVPYDFFELGTETWCWLHTTIYWHLAVVPSTFFYMATVHIHCIAKFPKLSALRASTQLKGYSDDNIFVIMNISSNTSSSENN